MHGPEPRLSGMPRPGAVPVAAQDARREELFTKSVEAEKGRDDALTRRFEEALRQAKREPVTRPTRDFDLD